MLTKEEFQKKIAEGFTILDGATGSNLRAAGMPRGCCTEAWILENPEPLVTLQRAYAAAGSKIIYAPTFQAQPIALKTVGLDKQTEKVNEALVALSRSAAPDCLIAGDITTLTTFCDSWDEDNFDLLVGETLMYAQEAEAILCAAELEGAGAQMYTFTMQSDGSLFSGADVGPILRNLEESGAAAVGFNCVAADMMTPYLVSKLRRFVRGPLICKPNAGVPTIGPDGIAHYAQTPEEFTVIMKQCKHNGATILGGCCGTAPEYIAAIRNI